MRSASIREDYFHGVRSPRDRAEARGSGDIPEHSRRRGFSLHHAFDSRRSSSGFPDLVLVHDRVISS